MGETDAYRYSLHVYDGHIVSRGHILGFDLKATRYFRGVYWHPYSPACRLYCKPLGLFLWERWHPIPVRAYNKSRYLAVRSGLAPDTPWPLSQACTGPILSMVRWSPSVSNNLLSGFYAEVCGMGHIPTYTNQMSLNNLIITCSWYIWLAILLVYTAHQLDMCYLVGLLNCFHTVSLLYCEGKVRLYKLRLQWREV